MISKHYRKLCGIPALGTGVFLLYHYGQKQKSDAWKVAFAGSLSLGITEFLFHPVDTTNSRCKANNGITHCVPYLRNMIANEGVKCLFRGIHVSCLTGFVGGFFYFFLYKHFKDLLKVTESRSLSQEFIRFFCAAFCSEVITVGFQYPLEMVKTRFQTSNHIYHYEWLGDALRRFDYGPDGRKRGTPFRSLYTGAFPFLCNFTLYTAIQFCCYEGIIYSLKALMKNKRDKFEASKEPFHFIGIALISGSVASICTNWIEVMTVRQQIEPSKKIMDILREEKLSIMTKGLLPRLIYNCCQTLTLFSLLNFFCKTNGVVFEG